MKVRIDFDEPEIGEDPETQHFTAVEFHQKCNTKDQWADAVLTFANPSIYGPAVILAQILNNGDNGFRLDVFARWLDSDTREELQKLLSETTAALQSKGTQ
jgi:hypothetical protein